MLTYIACVRIENEKNKEDKKKRKVWPIMKINVQAVHHTPAHSHAHSRPYTHAYTRSRRQSEKKKKKPLGQKCPQEGFKLSLHPRLRLSVMGEVGVRMTQE